MNVRATYRLQFHRGFTFADAEAIVAYLASLGISHLYASPIAKAQPGSSHGYDVVDPTEINPELGGEEAFRSLAQALRREGMGMIVDIVPNHMGVAGNANEWWMDVLAKGEGSRYARYFDINWKEKLLLPFLGEPIAEALKNKALALKRDEDGLAIWAYGTHRFPVRPEDQGESEDADLAALLDRQHYRLAWWRTANDNLHWRRFFTITELAGLRTEDPEVFEATHSLYFRLREEGLIDGVRVDHVDGLTDPATYCRRLRDRLGPDAYIVVEKILAPGEPMPPGWPVDGTSGYDFMEEVSALLHAPEGEEPLTEYWAALSGRPAEFEAEELQARQDMLSWEFEGQLAGCVRAFARLARSDPETRPLTEGMLRRAMRVLLWVFPVYRTYGTGSGAPPTDERSRAIARARAEPLAPPGEMPVVEQVLRWLAGEGPGRPELAAEAVRRFQQLSAPIAAKAVEDTAFYRYRRLLSRNDVGFDPGRFSLAPADFHAAMAKRAEDWPRAMVATATHDHKRGEDVRARLALLSEVPGLWIAAAERWREGNAAGDLAPEDEYALYQTLVGAWPAGLDAADEGGLAAFRERILAWQEKALREAKLRSSWADPDEEYEGKARSFLERIIDPHRSRAFLDDLAGFVERLRPAGEANALVQALLRNTVPGVPDLYQGCEFEDLSLVDPDNRRPVDFEARRHALASSGGGFDAAKQALIAKALRLRREDPPIWRGGRYEPVRAEGPRAANLLAFVRRHEGRAVLAAAILRCAPVLIETGSRVPPRGWWEDTRLTPEGREAIPAANLFAEAPVHLEPLESKAS